MANIQKERKTIFLSASSKAYLAYILQTLLNGSKKISNIGSKDYNL